MADGLRARLAESDLWYSFTRTPTAMVSAVSRR